MQDEPVMQNEPVTQDEPVRKFFRRYVHSLGGTLFRRYVLKEVCSLGGMYIFWR